MRSTSWRTSNTHSHSHALYVGVAKPSACKTASKTTHGSKESIMPTRDIFNYYIRLRDVQIMCFQRKRKAWAKAMGEQLKDLRDEYPHLKSYD